MMRDFLHWLGRHQEAWDTGSEIGALSENHIEADDSDRDALSWRWS